MRRCSSRKGGGLGDAPDRGLVGAKGNSPFEALISLRALSIAQDQGSRAWELRAATSLATLWKGGSKSHDGRTLLTGVLGWFTEGADTADVRNARTLLAELG